MARALEDRGLEKLVRTYASPIFTRRGGGVWPYFQPTLVKKLNGIQILGALGVHVPEFEEWWEATLGETARGEATTDDCLFALYITNLSRFRDPPLIRGKDDFGLLKSWVADISYVVRELPSSRDDFEMRASEDTFFERYSLRRLYCHPVKVFSFRRWCEKYWPQLVRLISLPDHVSRLHPFEEVFERVNSGVIDK